MQVKMEKRSQQGFTLIELVVVIIILGILAVTAAPKFLDLQTDARESTLEGVKGALQGANALLYSKASIQGLESGDKELVEVNPTIFVNTDYGYLRVTATGASIVTDLQNILEMTFERLTNDNAVVENDDWGVRRKNNRTISIVPRGKTATDECRIDYTESIQTGDVIAQPIYTVYKDEC